MAAAEPVLPFQALAEPDIEHALRDDRVERRTFGSGADRADGAAAEADGRREPDIDEVARGQPLRRGAGHAGPRMPTIADGSTDRTSAGGRRDAVAGPFQQATGDRRPISAIQRLEHVALGHGDLGGARALRRDVRREDAGGEALSAIAGLDAERQQLLGSAVDPGDGEADDRRADRLRP